MAFAVIEVVIVQVRRRRARIPLYANSYWSKHPAGDMVGCLRKNLWTFM